MSSFNIKTCSADRNPFRVSKIEALPFIYNQRSNKKALITFLQSHGFSGNIVGKKGSGKTTLMEELYQSLKGDRRCFLRRLSVSDKVLTSTDFSSIRAADLIFIDGGEQLSFFQWYYLLFLSRAKGLIVTSHRRIKRLPLLYSCKTSEELYGKLLSSLNPTSFYNTEEIKALFSSTAGNFREATFKLYRLCATSSHF